MIYCFKPTLDPDSIETAIKNIENNIVNLKGKIIKTEKLGRKKLAYEVKKYRDGFYASTYFELDPQSIKKLKRTMKLNDNVIRELTIRIDDINFYPALTGNEEQSTVPDNHKHQRRPVASESSR